MGIYLSICLYIYMSFYFSLYQYVYIYLCLSRVWKQKSSGLGYFPNAIKRVKYHYDHRVEICKCKGDKIKNQFATKDDLKVGLKM